ERLRSGGPNPGGSRTMTTEVAIVFHSGYGHTARQAEAVHRGAASVPGITAHLGPADGADPPWDLLARCEALICGPPPYSVGPAAQFKAFEDASLRTPLRTGAWRDKLGAGFTNSASRSGDKLVTLQQLFTFAAQHGMHWINLGLPPGNNASNKSEQDLNRL